MSALKAHNHNEGSDMSRKQFMNIAAIAGASLVTSSQASFADEGGRPESLDIDNFLRTGKFEVEHPFFV